MHFAPLPIMLRIAAAVKRMLESVLHFATLPLILDKPRTTIVKDEEGDFVADCHSIMARCRNYFSQLFNVHEVKDVRQTEIRALSRTTSA